MYAYEPKISIIVPVYNVEKYLKKCIDSIINQTYKNLEIILIDDGSKDNSGKICNEYAKEDSRIIVEHTVNKGVSCARNRGIELATGNYIMFIDSDDWVDFGICEELLRAMYKYDTESSMCSYIREYQDNSLPKVICEGDRLFDAKEFERKLCGPVGEELKHPENIDAFNMMWAKLYPVEIIKRKKVINISEVGTSEDLLYNFDVFHEIKNIVYINKPLYHYRKTVEFSITTKYKLDLDEKWDNLYDIIAENIKRNNLGEIYHLALNNRIALNTLGLGLNCFNDNTKISEKYKRLEKVILNKRRKEALEQLQLRYMPIYWKVFYFCAKKGLVLPMCFMLSVIKTLRGKV